MTAADIATILVSVAGVLTAGAAVIRAWKTEAQLRAHRQDHVPAATQTTSPSVTGSDNAG